MGDAGEPRRRAEVGANFDLMADQSCPNQTEWLSCRAQARALDLGSLEPW